MKKVIIFVIMLLPLFLAAQKLDQQLEKPANVFVGTPFKIHINLETAPEDSIFSPQYDSLDVFFLMKEPEQSDTVEEGIRKTSLTLTFQSFDTGEYTFPSLEFLVKKDNGSEILKTREFVVIVQSVLSDSAQAIRDIAKPLKLNFNFWDYFIPVFGIIVLTALIILLRKLLRRPESEEPVKIVKDSRPAYIKALEMLTGIDFEALLQSGNYVEYYFQLSIVLRYFIELHYLINALEMTTSEIRMYLLVPNPREKGDILNLLQEADKVKFAKHIPDSTTAREFLSWLDAYLKSFAVRSTEVQDA
ncbi:MAG: hypothetical protein K9N06_06175 [Candidatus Cloacimonetes bacterium]|nr:hypothetical protein [Candidatus Cloacimonadota bacterium]